MKVLVVIDFFLPGRKSGGPVTTLSNMIARLEEHLDLIIVTRNRDIDGSKYDLKDNTIIGFSQSSKIIYLNDKDFNPNNIVRIYRDIRADYIYLNSFFAKISIATLIHCKFRKIKAKIVLAPRGEFSKGALSIKSLKKKIYIRLFNAMKLDREVDRFQASSQFESHDILSAIGNSNIFIAPDLSKQVRHDISIVRQNPSKVIFFSRISPKKNLQLSIEIMSKIGVDAIFHIYGPIEDSKYWERCLESLKNMPSNIKFEYCGIISHESIEDTLSKYDVFLFPTLGENYGHVIWESLASGCPVVISDQTPWQDLEEKGVGFVIPLNQKEKYVSSIIKLIQEDQVAKISRARKCLEYAAAVSNDTSVVRQNIELFTG